MSDNNNIQTINDAAVPRDRAARNRANAAKSTGPKTAEGKQRASLNAFKHGLTGQTVVMPGEDMQAYEALVKSFHDDFRPKGAVELHLCTSLADICWRLNRSRAMEHNLLTLGVVDAQDKVNIAHPEAHTAMAMVRALQESNKLLATLSLHGQRLAREFDRTEKQLRERQLQRSVNERTDMPHAEDLMYLHNEANPKLEDPDYDPAEDGFVFSLDDLNTFIDRRERKERAREAAEKHAAA